MKIALTGATGFIGNYIVDHLAKQGHTLNCWYREQSNRERLSEYAESVSWLKGDLAEFDTVDRLIRDCDAVVHNAFWRPGSGFRGSEGDVVEFARVNILGTLNLIERSMAIGVRRFVFVSTCAVHERILSDRSLDEAHPLWPLSHYGAHKAAIEKFVHSYGFGFGFPICAIRPTGVYGVRDPVTSSKWYALVKRIVNHQTVRVDGGGKEVHASDVARGVRTLLEAKDVTGESYACYDRYVSEFEVAQIAKRISGSSSDIIGDPKTPRNEIATQKIESLGMEFGGAKLLNDTIEQLVEAVKADENEAS